MLKGFRLKILDLSKMSNQGVYRTFQTLESLRTPYFWKWPYKALVLEMEPYKMKKMLFHQATKKFIELQIIFVKWWHFFIKRQIFLSSDKFISLSEKFFLSGERLFLSSDKIEPYKWKIMLRKPYISKV